MRRFLLIIPLVLSLGACAQLQKLQQSFSVLTSSSVSPEAVVVAVNSFDALEATATNYLRLPRCTGSNGPVCRDPAVTPKIINAIRAGRTARNALLQFLKDHPGQLASQGVYDALQTAMSTIQAIYVQYNVGASR